MRQEMQAVVLAAGPGMRMTSLTSHTPKCMLPLGTLPMLCYPLHLLQQAGFTEAMVVVSEGQEQRVSKLVEQYGLKLDIEVAGVSTAHDPGTADSLRHIVSKIKKSVEDVVIVSSDLVTDVCLLDVLDQHRGRAADLTILTSPTPSFDLPPPGPKTKTHLNNDIICIEGGSISGGGGGCGGRLVYMVAGGDYDDTVLLQRPLLQCTSPLLFSTSTQDAHLYIIKRWLLDYTLNKESPCADMGSLKAEILPHIVSCQFADYHSFKKGRIDAREREEWSDLVCKHNTSTLPSRLHCLATRQSPVCLTYHHKGGVCVRANTMQSYWNLNRKIKDIFEKVYPDSEWQLRHPSAHIHEKAQVSDDSVVGSGAVLCERTNITSSVVGKHCRINPLVRITNSVLGDHVTLVSGCVVENSLILASVERKCTIKNCIVADPNKIEENKIYNSEVLEATQDFA